jgi:hypothetical protein
MIALLERAWRGIWIGSSNDVDCDIAQAENDYERANNDEHPSIDCSPRVIGGHISSDLMLID